MDVQGLKRHGGLKSSNVTESSRVTSKVFFENKAQFVQKKSMLSGSISYETFSLNKSNFSLYN